MALRRHGGSRTRSHVSAWAGNHRLYHRKIKTDHRTNRFTEPPPGASVGNSAAKEGRRSVSFLLDGVEMKRVFLILLALVVLGIAYVSWDRWDAAKNRGHMWGYWGQFNTVSNALAGIPGITILKPYYNADITLEEFGFDVTTSEGRKLHIGFEERDPTRKLSGAELERALLKLIRKQASNKSPEPTAVSAFSSAVAVPAASRRWLSFLRYPP
jgi:hypothetical protein